MVTINGKQYEVSGKTIAAYLTEAKYDLQRVAVELNGEIVSKGKLAETIMQDGDVMEVVSFVGGG